MSEILTLIPVTERICSYLNFEEAVSFLSLFRITNCNCCIPIFDEIDQKNIILPGINPTTIAIYRLIKRVGTQQAFQLSASRGNNEMVKILLKIDQQFYGTSAYLKESGIIWAATNGHISTIQTLISVKGNIHYTDLWDNTALIAAAHNNHKLAAQYLIEQGINVNATDYWGNSALSIAVSANNFGLVQLLVESKANIQQPIWGNQTALILAQDPFLRNYLQSKLNSGQI